MGLNSTKKHGPMQRISAATVTALEGALAEAGHSMEPRPLTQRQAFRKLMPHIAALHKRGCSWEQLAAVLRKGGFSLTANTVRSYFFELSKEEVHD